MIRIVKPTKAPKTLTTKGAEQTRKDCAAYDNSSTAYRTGKKKFRINRRIYGDMDVKDILLRAQHDKCCYCETKFRHSSPGAVEHYRPKGAVKQVFGQSIEYPGYYWLAYEWNNLLVICESCNRHKGFCFPLVDNNARARNHHDDIAIEQPLLINPTVEDPRAHIRFRGDAPEPHTEIGRITIQYLGLRKAKLEEDRRERLALLKVLRDLIEATKNANNTEIQRKRDEAIELFAAAVRPEAEYSAMVQDLINSSTSETQSSS